MTRILLIASFALSVFADARAVEVDVGGQRMEIPVPAGFTELTPAMSPQYEMLQAYVAPTNVRFLSLIPEDKSEALLRGEVVDLRRYFNLESAKDLSINSVSPTLFAEIRRNLNDQVMEVYSGIEEQLPEMLGEGNASLSEEYAADIAIDVGGLVPLPIHYETENAIAHSLYMTVGGRVDGESFDNMVLAATTLILHVGDKVLFLYTYGTREDLEWTREAAGAWANDIVAANAGIADAPGESASASDGFLRGIVIAALIGGLLAIGFASFRRRT